MKKRFCTLLLCLSLLLGSLPAMAAEGSIKNFLRSRTYDGRFADVTAGSWYYNNISYLYELGLTEGQDTHTFGVNSSITVAEALGFAARIHSTYYLGHPEAGPKSYGGDGDVWYRPYLRYLTASGVITETQFEGQYDRPATRAQTAYILGSALPDSEFTAINDTAVTVGYARRLYITDINDYTPYQQDILQLYKWGILTGSDAKGSFCPDTHISRSEFAAMLTRLVNPALRQKLDWDVSSAYTAKGTTYADLVQDGDAFYPSHALNDLAAVDANVRHMLMTGAHTISLRFEPKLLTEAFATQLMNHYLATVRTYIEQGYNAVSCKYSTSSGTVTFTFSSSLFSSNFADARQATLEDAIAVHDHLWQTGTIHDGMSEREKALAYYTWVCDNSSYDHRAIDSSLSHSAYSLFTMGSAVCDGYTAAYNLLLKLEGIQCSTASTADHIWTVATLDGTLCHIDTTWGDQSGVINYAYFAMTPADSLSRF